MNFNPQNRANLESLVAALGNGLDPSVGMSVLNQTIADQQQRVDQRKAQLQSWGGQVADMAMQGMPQAQATTMMDLLTPKPGVPQGAQRLLDTAYPAPDMSSPNNPLWNPQTGSPTASSIAAMPDVPGVLPSQQPWATAQPQGMAQSPLYTDNPMLQPQPEPPGLTEELGGFLKGIAELRSAGYGPDEIMSQIMSNPQTMGLYVEHQDKLAPVITWMLTQGTPEQVPNPLTANAAQMIAGNYQ